VTATARAVLLHRQQAAVTARAKKEHSTGSNKPIMIAKQRASNSSGGGKITLP